MYLNKNYSTFSLSFSYGVVLWELLTGETPYKGMEPLQVLYCVGVQKISLPIPKTCPLRWRSLMESKFYGFFLLKYILPIKTLCASSNTFIKKYAFLPCICFSVKYGNL